MKKQILAILIVPLLVACGSDGENVVSEGLKIFVTDSRHVGDFENDPLIEGSSAIEKMDSFCNSDSSKPNGSVYKALAVDGMNRDALSELDWVLESNTVYYRAYNDIEIGKTSDQGVFTSYYADLPNSVSNKKKEQNGPILANNVWTGIRSPIDFSSDTASHCNYWSASGSSGHSGKMGLIYDKGSYAFASENGSFGCDLKASLYCVEQQDNH